MPSETSETFTLQQLIEGPAKDMDVARVVALIISKIVKFPEAVSIDITYGAHTTVMDISTDKRDKGPLIGKQGHIQNSLRVVTRAMLREQAANKRFILSLVADEDDTNDYDDGGY